MSKNLISVGTKECNVLIQLYGKTNSSIRIRTFHDQTNLVSDAIMPLQDFLVKLGLERKGPFVPIPPADKKVVKALNKSLLSKITPPTLTDNPF